MQYIYFVRKYYIADFYKDQKQQWLPVEPFYLYNC